MSRLLIALAALSVIVGGCRYAYGRERLRKVDLDAWYREDNARYFGGQLEQVYVRWGGLQKEGAWGITRSDEFGYLEIVLDRYELRTETDARVILRHEECHVATLDEVSMHGPRFQECMRRAGFVELE
jgi:SprT-like family